MLPLRVLLASILLAAAACHSSHNLSPAPAVQEGFAQSTPVPDSDNTPEAAAQRAIFTLRRLTNEKTYKDLGFESPTDAERVSLGHPLHVFVVRLDRLREFKAGDNVQDLLTDARRFIFPAMIDGKPRSTITIELLNGRWEAVGFGGLGVIREYIKVRQMKGENHNSQFVAVQIPAMQLNFLGQGVGGESLVLTPLPSNSEADRGLMNFDNDRAIVGFGRSGLRSADRTAETAPNPLYATSSTDRTASEVFTKLAPQAKKINSDVPR